eukprot:CAMPEP_0170488056 /NCGR_PEP_ID=MMETSP0208-20121228/6682_1 /TAXON_ID=197538 /ORGANISM="Strombidium inclinatum, Strain S3" /LENGTH=94 /DNA_ID=CAMNT_0010762491 /DNA_START=2148 /DNA_END=2432 /DNA_ORIENTATION=+
MARGPRYGFDLSGQEYAFALAAIDGFHDESHAALLLLDKVHQLVGLIGEDPRLGEESKLGWPDLLLHKFEVFGEVILQGKHRHPREMIDLLVGF